MVHGVIIMSLSLIMKHDLRFKYDFIVMSFRFDSCAEFQPLFRTDSAPVGHGVQKLAMASVLPAVQLQCPVLPVDRFRALVLAEGSSSGHRPGSVEVQEHGRIEFSSSSPYLPGARSAIGKL